MRDDGLYKRGRVWWCRYTGPDGEPGRGSTKTTDRAVAKQRKRDWFELGKHPDRSAHKARGTLGGALSHLLDVVYAGRNPHTVKSYRQKARHLVRVLGEDAPLGTITRARCQEYRAQRLGEGAHAHSIYKEAVVLRLVLAEQGIEGVVPKFKAEYKPRTRYLTLDDFQALLGHLKQRRQFWIVAACFLGGRDSELLKARWEGVDFAARRLHVKGTKTKGADRKVPLHPFILFALALACPKSKRGPILDKWTSRRRDMTAAYWKVVGFDPPRGWSKGFIMRNGVKVKVSIKGAPRLSPNDLRRTFASWLKQRGADSSAVADLMGSSAKMIDLVYGKLDDDARARVVALLPE